MGDKIMKTASTLDHMKASLRLMVLPLALAGANSWAAVSEQEAAAETVAAE